MKTTFNPIKLIIAILAIIFYFSNHINGYVLTLFLLSTCSLVFSRRS